MTGLHGTVSRYTNNGCRCTKCRAASAAYQHQYHKDRLAQAKADPSIVPHGTNNGYTSYGCRCCPCTTARAEVYCAKAATA